MLLMEELKSRVERNKASLVEYGIAGGNAAHITALAAEVKAYQAILSMEVLDD